MESEQKYHGKTIEYWKKNAEEDYIKAPISVLKYITILEEALSEVAPKEEKEELSGFKPCEIGKENHDIYRRGDFFLCKKCNFKMLAK